ncbi:hypothetical protein Tco_1124998 [Tanacetum coccineum]|uniref:Uncharacterized protein n=1 Tax=Tanacetum coccineum TaxID=301880 RepID=A0ABQ5JAR2_9ASTR
MENIYPKHGLISRTYSKKSLIMALIFGSKSKFSMTMSIPSQDKPFYQSTGGKLRVLNPEESWVILEDLALYENKSLNDLRDFAKPVKAIALPQDVLSTSDRLLIELENQVQRLMEAYLAPTQPTQVNKITTPCEICSGPTTFSVAWKTPNKPSLNTHLCVPMKREITILKTNTPYPSRRYGISVPALTKDHRRLKSNTPYPEDSICRIQDMESI